MDLWDFHTNNKSIKKSFIIMMFPVLEGKISNRKIFCSSFNIPITINCDSILGKTVWKV